MVAFHMTSKHGGFSKANIIIVDNDGNKYFQSYEEVRAKYIPLTKEFEITTREMSQTVRNYLTSFIHLCTKQEVGREIDEIMSLDNVRMVERVA
jgi:hypothetical protein